MHIDNFSTIPASNTEGRERLFQVFKYCEFPVLEVQRRVILCSNGQKASKLSVIPRECSPSDCALKYNLSGEIEREREYEREQRETDSTSFPC